MLSRYMDGEENTIDCFSKPGIALCDNCLQFQDGATEPNVQEVFDFHQAVLPDPQQSTFSDVHQRSLQLYQDGQKSAEAARAVLCKLKDICSTSESCAYCFLDGNPWVHAFASCKHVDYEDKEAAFAIGKSLKSIYNESLACHTCHFTGEVCKDWEECSTIDNPVAIAGYVWGFKKGKLKAPNNITTLKRLSKNAFALGKLAEKHYRYAFMGTLLTATLSDALQGHYML